MTKGIEKIASGFIFTEGPVWHPDNYLLFSDIPANKIFRMDSEGTVQVYLDNSGLSNTDTSQLSDMIGSNGLAIDKDRNIIICQHGNHALAKLEQTQLSLLVDCYDNRPFNSPNDLIIHSDGSVFFTDPPYGLKEQVLHPDTFQRHAGIYKWKEGKLSLINTDLQYPNGVCFSPDEKFLYVSSNQEGEALLLRFELGENGTIGEPILFAKQNADGMTTDKQGNLFLCTNEGIVILTPQGKRKAFVSLPESPANITWGGEDRNWLYITARTSIYRLNPVSVCWF